LLYSAFFISQCFLVVYVVQNFLIDDTHLILSILNNVVMPRAGHGWSPGLHWEDKSRSQVTVVTVNVSETSDTVDLRV